MTDGVHLSFGEVQDLCTKAARGAGLSWGLAEEAGYSTRWLFARGLDGPKNLLEHLEAGAAHWPIASLQDGAMALPTGEALSPLNVGTAFSDVTSKPCEFQAGPVHKPLLLLPFLYLASSSLNESAVLAWGGGRVAVSPAGALSGDVLALAATDASEVTVSFLDARLPSFEVAVQGLEQETISALNAFAMETTVPATEASRADAGSSDGDND